MEKLNMTIPTIGEGIIFIEGSDEERQTKCTEAINHNLNQFDCAMVPRFIVLGKNMVHDVTIIANPRDKTPMQTKN